MLEKDIENLIARYPEEFFPKSDFNLIGQQVNLSGRRHDIVFKDKFDRSIIVEVKRGILSRDASGQIMEYYGLLKQEKPDEIVELILCANVIPRERKLFLENAGIECKELGISLIQNIAEKYDYKFLDEVKNDKPKEAKEVNISEKISETDTTNIWIFQANPERYDILNALDDPALETQYWQVNQYKKQIKKGDIALIWMSGKEAGIYAVAEITSNPDLLIDIAEEEKYWVNEKDKGQERLKVTIRIIMKMVNNPVYRVNLKGVQGLQDLKILKIAQGTNFPVTKEEWDIIKAEIEEKQL